MACKAKVCRNPAHEHEQIRLKAATERPLAAFGLISYRYPGAHSFVMIGARDNADALKEAERSIEGPATIDKLEVWDGKKYSKVSK